MRKTITYPLFALILFLLFWTQVPPLLSDRWCHFVSAPFGKRAFDHTADELACLQLENRALRLQMDNICEWFLQEKKIAEQLDDKEFLQKQVIHLKERLISTPAQVIYRDPSLWSSSLWVNVGESTNRAIGAKVVAKNSPVLTNGALVGVVEFVGEKQSRVRLITDSGLSPSVRVSRGGLQNRELVHQMEALYQLLEKRDDLEKTDLLRDLQVLKKSLGANWDDGYLARGEVRGSSSPFWRARNLMLKGIGFHFDSPEGSASSAKVPILKEGDLLVTTGLDGVFPPGISVGIVMKVAPQRPGSYAYDIDVRPIVSHFNDLQTLCIIAPVGD